MSRLRLAKEIQSQPYELPVGSPLEGVFWYELRKVINEEARVTAQAECEFKNGRRPFVLDFLVEIKCRLIGLECDGRQYHEDRKSDAFRDDAIWKAGMAHRIYRLRGHDIYCRPFDLFSLLEVIEPALFSIRGKTIVETRSTIGYSHEDSFAWEPHGRYITDFPGRAVRWYNESERDLDDDREEVEYDLSPLVIYYTGKRHISV